MSFCSEDCLLAENDVNSIISSDIHSSPLESSPALSNSCEGTRHLPNVCAAHIGCLHCFGDLASFVTMEWSFSIMNSTQRYFFAWNLSIAVSIGDWSSISGTSQWTSPPSFVVYTGMSETNNPIHSSNQIMYTSSYFQSPLPSEHLFWPVIFLLLKTSTPVEFLHTNDYFLWHLVHESLRHLVLYIVYWCLTSIPLSTISKRGCHTLGIKIPQVLRLHPQLCTQNRCLYQWFAYCTNSFWSAHTH